MVDGEIDCSYHEGLKGKNVGYSNVKGRGVFVLRISDCGCVLLFVDRIVSLTSDRHLQ